VLLPPAGATGGAFFSQLAPVQRIAIANRNVPVVFICLPFVQFFG
jgi:hypothetical protein